MDKVIYPEKLKRGDEIRIITPSFSMAKWPKELLDLAIKRFTDMGLVVSFGKHVREFDDFESSSIESRIFDLHEAFGDKSVKGVMCAVGGYNANYLLEGIDWEIIRQNPKFFCGMSDITVLSNAILAKTGLVTYSGPNFRNFGQKMYFDFTLEYFKKLALKSETIKIGVSEYWSDDKWAKKQEKRKLIKNKGWWVINQGEAIGQVVGGNLCSLNLLQGTEYMPRLKNKLLMIEDDSMSTVGEFSRNWRSLMHMVDFSEVVGVIFGRFQKKTKMTKKLLTAMIKSLPQINDIPIIGNVDFGHTDPKITFPIGGIVKMVVGKEGSEIKIVEY